VSHRLFETLIVYQVNLPPIIKLMFRIFLKLIDHSGCAVELSFTQLPPPFQGPYRGEAMPGNF